MSLLNVRRCGWSADLTPEWRASTGDNSVGPVGGGGSVNSSYGLCNSELSGVDGMTLGNCGGPVPCRGLELEREELDDGLLLGPRIGARLVGLWLGLVLIIRVRICPFTSCDSTYLFCNLSKRR